MADDPNRPEEKPWDARPPHLQRWIDKRNGRERIYLRKAGIAERIELKAPWGSQALADEAAAALARLKTRPAPEIGTLVGAVRAYRGDALRGIPASAEFLGLSIATQARYERWLDAFEKAFDGVLLEEVDAAYVLALRDRWALKGHEAANTALQVLKNVCKRPIILGAIPADPFTRIDKVARPHGLGIRNPRWEDAEVDAVIAYARDRKRPGFMRAVALGRWGGFRRQTICGVPLRARVVRKSANGAPERRLLWVTEKKEVLCDRREDLRLTALLADTPDRALTIAYNADGHPWRPRQLNQALERVIETLSKRGEVRDTLTIHGLRHARGVEIAHLGGSDAEIMAQLDHTSTAAAQSYRKQAERLHLADNAQDRVDAEVIRLRDLAEKR